MGGFQSNAFQTSAFQSSTPAPLVVTTPVLTTATSNLSLVFDPITRDVIDTDDGWFLESDDSRTLVLFQLDATYNAWWGDPFSGSRTAKLRREGTADDLRDEALRALQPLVSEGILSDLEVALDTAEGGRTAILLNYLDRASARQVDLVYVPFGG